MKVLMFGWEYPPHVFGGLATANYGICGYECCAHCLSRRVG